MGSQARLVSAAEASVFGIGVAVPIVKYLLFIAMILMGLALLKEISG